MPAPAQPEARCSTVPHTLSPCPRSSRQHEACRGDLIVLAAGQVLLFLSADTALPRGWDERVRRCLEKSDVFAGSFDLTVEPKAETARKNWKNAEAAAVRSPSTDRMGPFPNAALPSAGGVLSHPAVRVCVQVAAEKATRPGEAADAQRARAGAEKARVAYHKAFEDGPRVSDRPGWPHRAVPRFPVIPISIEHHAEPAGAGGVLQEAPSLLGVGAARRLGPKTVGHAFFIRSRCVHPTRLAPHPWLSAAVPTARHCWC